MKIASLVVRTRPERVRSLAAEIARIEGAEVHATQAEGRLVVTIEDVNGGSTAENIVKVHNLGGVIGVSLVYEHNEEDTATEALQS